MARVQGKGKYRQELREANNTDGKGTFGEVEQLVGHHGRHHSECHDIEKPDEHIIPKLFMIKGG
jgi:hypothetical protein